MPFNKALWAKTLIIISSLLLLLSATTQANDEQFSCYEEATKQHVRKVIGGKEKPDSLKSYPWMVNLFSKIEGASFCGGTLINKNLVLTAAHCVISKNGRVRLDYKHFIVRQASANGDTHGEYREVVDIKVHPEYNKTGRIENDIALILLDSDFAISDHQIIRLLNPTTAKTWAKPNHCAKAIGWGLEHNQKPSEIIREVNLKIKSRKECKQAWVKVHQGKTLPASSICAGFDTVKKDVCKGDSGGPLFVKGGPTQYLLAGLVSFGIPCHHTDIAMVGVYTQTAMFSDWIRDTARIMRP